MTNIGKQVRLGRIFENNRTVIVPVDDSLIAGPNGGLRNIRETIQAIVSGGVNAILGFEGAYRQCYELLRDRGSILNLSASTIRSAHTRKVLTGDVTQAVALGFDAVAVHVNITSQYESEMIGMLGFVSRECQKLGMPLIALMYPRTERNNADWDYDDLKKGKRDKYTELIRHAVRVGVELGADVVKTHYTGDLDSFRSVIETACGVPVIVAGGPKVPLHDIARVAYESVQAGGAGVCFGRNTFMRDDPADFVRTMRLIVHENATPENVTG